MKALQDASFRGGLVTVLANSTRFGSEAVNQNDVIADQVPRAAGICYLCHQEKEVWGHRPWLPRTGEPCSAQRPGSL